jgi:hypothetical protein
MTARKTTPKKKEPGKKKLTAAELLTVLTKLEKPIRSQPFETAVVLDEYGKELLRRAGTKNEVNLRDAENILRRCRVLTHNHPSGGSFSYADVREAVLTNLPEIRCFGTEYRYSLKPGKSGWGVTPAGIAKEWNDTLNDLYPKYQELFNTLSKKIGQVNAQREVAIQHTHEVMQILAKRHNFIYRRSKW